ncbi:MAG: hypothetical protein JNL40_13935 [Cyclobacteriaceae bacterium]|nr:hypothetical protein [Cyclobacteriaceae bacterium]
MRGFIAILVLIGLFGCEPKKNEAVVVEEEVAYSGSSTLGSPTLSSYGFFSGELKRLEPASGVLEYSINAALFSDYAFKKRLIKLPPGNRMSYHPKEVFEFPEGTVLIKNFYYPADFRKPDEKVRLLETRLLILKGGTWEPLAYIWNKEQTEAYLEVAGKSIPVSWVHTDGVMRTIDYSVPNLNQCKGCHLKGDKVMPIGPTARQLNHGVQLTAWRDAGLLTDLPDTSKVPRLASYENPHEAIADRARSWLEINCAHCHRPDGQAKTSGLHLSADVTSALALGIGKAPVAAGKGSGGRLYSVVPGHPEESILLYRIESTDPGIMMPEMGRKLVHTEGVDLVRQWILSMK